MPEVARMSGVDIVNAPDGSPGTPCDDDKFICDSPTIQHTQEGSSTVTVGGIGVVREGDKMTPHPAPVCGCAPHHPPMVICSAHVSVEGKRLARKGDFYVLDCNHPIGTGMPTVFDGSPQA